MARERLECVRFTGALDYGDAWTRESGAEAPHSKAFTPFQRDAAALASPGANQTRKRGRALLRIRPAL
jgi:hypothetical protein